MDHSAQNMQSPLFDWHIAEGVLHIKQTKHVFEVTSDTDALFKLYEHLKSISTNRNIHALIYYSHANDSTFSASWKSMALALPMTTANKRAERYFNAINNFITFLSTLKIPTVHIASGLNSLLSLNISLSFDYRIAMERTMFENPNAALGVITKGSGYYLPKILGEMKAIEILGWRQFSAEEALSLGLIDKIIKQDDVEQELSFLTTQEFTENRPYILSLRKLYKCNLKDLEQSLAHEDELIRARLISPSFERLFEHHCVTILGVTPEQIRSAHHAQE
ncbi:enoyl-CoA hydratase/isomerase family protein [Fundidesulfovibrio soli]|uniref:enoyl-CoA hydratase/isomerase family protein n=1 Tax=Fundidesulfovibrio soli TaxID=2922716 RepID=UPI001FAE9905|nr:enoyl-CoA hydratase/isomerase family protein [Fundidesulfovibrio soli]